MIGAGKKNITKKGVCLGNNAVKVCLFTRSRWGRRLGGLLDGCEEVRLEVLISSLNLLQYIFFVCKENQKLVVGRIYCSDVSPFAHGIFKLENDGMVTEQK